MGLRRTFAACALLLTVIGCNSGGGPRRIECGGTGSFPCPPGMFCDLGKRCGGVDRVGYCSYQPTEECGAEEDPVCGCDGVEYSNECLANSGGVSMDYKGPCMKDVPKTKPSAKIEPGR